MEGDDWIDIAPASGPETDNVRRADTDHPLDFFRGRDFSGHYLFSLTADIGCRDLPRPPRLNGIDVSLERRMVEGARLVLVLQEQDQFDIFRALCDHLLRATAGLPHGANSSGIRLVLRRLADWHKLFRRRREDLLSNSEVIGLAGELLFFRDEIVSRASPIDAVFAWRGAHRDKQDFSVGPTHIEIKTQLSTADQRFLIASEGQLHVPGGRLLLCHQSLSATPMTANSFTLNSLVDELAEILREGGAPVVDIFELALEASGFVRRSEYDQPSWILTNRQLYDVTEGFPRITPALLPSGIQHVSYEILLSACDPFIVDLTQTIDSVF